MIKLSNIIIDEDTINTIESIELNGVPTLHITTNIGKLHIAIYASQEDRTKAVNNLTNFLNINCC